MKDIVPVPAAKEIALPAYDKACRALGAAKSFADVKDVLNEAEAIRAYARMAKNKTLEIDATELRIRAERKFGEMEIAKGSRRPQCRNARTTLGS
jgi:hypothetical protein